MKTPNTDDEKNSTLQRISQFILRCLIRIVISFIVVTVGFVMTSTPILATATVTLAWLLTASFVSVASCLLTMGEK